MLKFTTKNLLPIVAEIQQYDAAMLLAKDEGIYVLSSEGVSKDGRRTVAYAEGYDPAKFLDGGELYDACVDAVLLHARRQFLEVRHNPVRHRRIEFVIAREGDDRLRELCPLQLESGDAHFNSQPFRFGTARDYATIIITENHNGPVTQVGTKHFFTARIERIHVSERKHQFVPRVLCMNAITTPNICSSSG